MEPKTTAVFEQFRKPTTTTSSSAKELATLTTRPIATNSRLKRDEKYRRDMYLAFIDNALSQKAKVSRGVPLKVHEAQLIEMSCTGHD